MDLPDVLRLGKQIADGLAAAHEQGLIHRDIKPGNILLEGGMDERVKITDFGLARAADDASMTQSGVIAGTPMYMAPEQAHGHKLDQRADLFSFGSVLYQMLSGRPPFRAPTTMAVLKRVTEDTPRPIQEIIPETPAWMAAIVGKLLAKNPEKRFALAREVSDLLSRCLADIERLGGMDLSEETLAMIPPEEITKGDAAAPNDIPYPAPPKPAARPQLRIWAAAALLVLAIGLGVSEGTGVTDMRGTVIRFFSPSGTLVVEVDDPGLSVTIDGEDMVITGAGERNPSETRTIQGVNPQRR